MAEEKKQQNVEAEKSSKDNENGNEKFCTNCWTWINVKNDPDHPQHCSKDR